MQKRQRILMFSGIILLMLVFVLWGILANPAPPANEPATPQPDDLPVQIKTANLEDVNQRLTIAVGAISSERMFTTLENLTSIQEHSGWRGAGTAGEKEALDYIQTQINSLSWLASSGMEVEREEFNVFLTTEDHTSSLFLSDAEKTIEIPADGIRGPRDDPANLVYIDSDGQLNDTIRSPVTVEGEVVLIPDAVELNGLKGADLRKKVLMVDYGIVDTINPLAIYNVNQLMELSPAAVVLVTRFSNTVGESHGTFVGDGGGVFQRTTWARSFPLLFIELENLTPFGISDWDSMHTLTHAQVVWDIDVVNPGESGNLILHIPGGDPAKPVLISAHIDSPNSPGALDDGSGSAILLEIASLLNQSQIKPQVDLYLAWFGSEELGLYGSTYFTTSHSDLLSRLQADLQIDCLSRPLTDLPAKPTLMFSHVSSTNLYTDPWTKYLVNRGGEFGIDLGITFWPFASDNGSLSAFDTPNVNLIYQSDQMDNVTGGVWYAGHFHDPYDTVELAREMEAALTDMTRMALTAAFIPPDDLDFVDHQATKKVVFLANHTESPHMTPAGFPEFSLALIRAGYEVSVIPYGQELKLENLSEADLVVVLPVYDYALSNAPYDTAWTSAEANLIDKYAEDGGRVLVINSGHRLKLYNRVMDKNEDWSDLNILTSQWGVVFAGLGSTSDVWNTEDRGILEDVPSIQINPDNAVSFQLENGEALAGSKNKAYLAWIEVGKGEVIVLGDMAVLGESDQGLLNPQLVSNLAKWE